MEFWKDWHFWAQLLSLAGTVIIFCYQWFSHNKIVGNDLHHLSADVKKIAQVQDAQNQKLGKVAEDVAYLKGRDSVRQTQYKKRK